MNWTVTIHRRATKRIGKLPEAARKSLIALIRAIETDGPAATGRTTANSEATDITVT